MKIRAAVTEVPGAPFAIEDHELEMPRTDEVLVRIVVKPVLRMPT